MALILSKTGTEISTERLFVKATSDNVNCDSVQMRVFYQGITAEVATLVHEPDAGTTDEFTFEINSIIREFLKSNLFDINSPETFDKLNGLATLRFQEIESDILQPAAYDTFVNVKDFSLDNFELDLIDLDVYDLGSGTGKKFLTSSNSEVAVGDAPFYVSVLAAANSGTPNFTAEQRWVIQKYDVNNTLLTTSTVNLVQGVRFTNVGANTYDIANLTVQLLEGEYKAVVFVQDIASPNTVRSESKTFIKGCDGVQLQWVNEFGVVDTHLFEARLVKEIDSKEETFTDFDRVERVFKNDWNYTWQVWTGAIASTTVDWLTRMLRNRKARVVFKGDGLIEGDKWGYLYNWYTLNNGVVGDGRDSGGIVNTTLTGWVVPTAANYKTLSDFIAPSNQTGNQVRTTSFTDWSDITGATNSSGFSAVGAGLAAQSVGYIERLERISLLTTTETSSTTLTRYTTSINNMSFSGGVHNKSWGASIRLFRPAIGGENDGDLIVGAYVGNDGKIYDGIVIGTQVWINRNLAETKFNNGSNITKLTGGWVETTEPRFASYDDEVLTEDVTKPNRAYPIILEDATAVHYDNFDPLINFKVKFRFAKNRRGI